MRSRLLLFVLIVLSHLAASGAIYKSGQYYYLSKKDTLHSDLFYGGRELKLDGVVKSDAVLGAETVRLTGEVQDDMYAWAKEIFIEGNIGDTFLGFAKDIRISGVVHGDVIAYGGSVYVLPGAKIEGNLYVGTGYLSIDEAVIGGNIRGGARNLMLNGTCGGNIDLSGTMVKFGEQFKSSKEVNITLHEKPLEPIPNAPANLHLTIEKQKHFYQKAWFYYFLFSAFVVGALLIGLLPSFFNNLIALSRKKISVNLLSGLVYFIITPIIMVILMIIFPLGVLLTVSYFAILYLSKIFASYIIGYYIMQRIKPSQQINNYLSFLMGLVVISLVIHIPGIGMPLYLLAIILGGGTFIHYLFLVMKNGKSVNA